MSYVPSDKILEKYAKVLVNFAIGSGKGVKPGEVVYLQGPTSAMPFYNALSKQLIKSGAMVIGGLSDDMHGMGKFYFDNANQKQLTTFLDKYYKGLVDQTDHRIAIIADHDVHELDGVDPKKMMLRQKTAKPLIKWFDAKENAGKYTWTLGLYGTPSMAKEAGLSEKAYWDQIIKACFLDKPDPIAEWKKSSKEVLRVVNKLNKLQIKDVHLKGNDVDLKITIGEKRQWLGASGRNIPSFEVFTSPDWRGTEGWIRFNQPLYYYGPKVQDIELTFKGGRVVKAKASKNQKLLKEMLATDAGASQLGEFSMTDKRLSHITKFMAETLFDENMGGPYGNTHVAVGRSYVESYVAGANKVTPALIKKLGFNESVIHVDMITTTDRIVTATFKDGSQKVIYKKGQFTI